MTEELVGNEERTERFLARIPLARMASSRSSMRTLLLLASRAGSYITGQTIVVDGGTSLI